MTQRLLAIVTDSVDGPEPIEALTRDESVDLQVHVVMPAVEETAFRHTMGDVDGPIRDASERLQASLEQLRRNGIEASGEVGDADPVLAAQDALRERPADEVVILERAPGEARWFEQGLFDRAREELSPPLKLILVDHDSDGAGHVVAVEAAPRGTEDVRRDVGGTVEISENMPRFSRGDLGGMVLGVVGTIVAAILSATVGPETAAGAVAILIAIGIALINLAHVVGLLLMESVRYRGGFEAFFRTLALIGTPVAVLINLVIALTN